jgi:hypothetical protein
MSFGSSTTTWCFSITENSSTQNIMSQALATGKENLEKSLNSATALATGAVSNTLEISNNALNVASKVTGSAVNTAGVLGEESVKAIETIGKTAIEAGTGITTTALSTGADVTKAALSTGADVTKAALSEGADVTKAALSTGADVTKAALSEGADVTKAALSTGTKVTKAALSTGADVTENALKASNTIVNAATQATADVTKTAVETTSSTLTITTEQVGSALNAGIILAGRTTTDTINALNNIEQIIANAGRNVVESKFQKQDASLQGIQARKSTDIKTELLKTLEKVQKQMMATLSTLHGIQKTALIAQMNVYKRAKCGFFRRMTGFCDKKLISNDIKATELYINDFKYSLGTAYQTAESEIMSMQTVDIEQYRIIENKYTTSAAEYVNKFVSSYKTLIDKYNELTRKSLESPSGGRRRTRRYHMRRRLTRRRK